MGTYVDVNGVAIVFILLILCALSPILTHWIFCRDTEKRPNERKMQKELRKIDLEMELERRRYELIQLRANNNNLTRKYIEKD